MIIESGHDLRLVLGPAEHQIAPKRICIVPLDEELRLITVIELVPASEEPDVIESLPAIAQILVDETPEARYLAIAWATDRVTGRGVEWLHELDERIRGDGLLGPVRLLGQIVFAADGTAVTVPQCDFTLYPELRELPRTVSVPGPHGDSCSCPVCERERRFFEQEYSDWMYPESFSGDYPAWDDDDDEFSRARERQSPNFHARRPSLYAAPQVTAGIDDTPRYDPFWNRWYPAPERSCKRWTRDEEDTLVSAHAEGMSCFDISILLRRQPGAIAARLNRLGLSARTVVPGEDQLPEATGVAQLPPVQKAGGELELPTLFDD
jgi:hypothetical protein